MKTIKLSVQEFAFPSPRRGSIEPSSGFNTPQKGIELHKKVQEERHEELSNYQSEVSISWSFQCEEYRFEVSGRIDGLVSGHRPLIEEIKSSFNIFELAKALKERRYQHPYFLQLLTYGYIHFLKNEIKPDLAFYLISSRREESYAFEVFWDIKEYEAWLKRRLEELVLEARRAEKRSARRKKIGANLPFPFSSPRKGQRELIECIKVGMSERKRLLLQAPTGLGKTMGVLHPSLEESLARGQRVVYLTPKNSQQAIAEEGVEKLQEKGCNIKSLTITAKSKLCLKAEPLCNPEYCEFARDYYDKLLTFDLKSELAKKKRLSSRVMKNMAEKYEVCPFELQLEALEEADVVICDYNYVFGNDSILGKISSAGFSQEGKPNLVIDEAHNLPSRTMGNFSPMLGTSQLESIRKDIPSVSKRFRDDLEELVDDCTATVTNLTPEKKGTKSVQLNAEIFLALNEKLKGFLSTYLDSDIDIKPKDPVLKLVFYWSDFTEVLAGLDPASGQFFLTGSNDGKSRTLKITCCDASALIRDRYDYFQQIILFSATLKPFDYYIRLSGLAESDLLTKEFHSPFKKENRKILIIPQVSTKYSVREQNYLKIAAAIEKIMALRPGNYLAFFPSFDFLENVLKLFQIPPGFRLLKQSRFMRTEEVEAHLNLLRSRISPMILFAVQGGVFSEGIDYGGEMAIGAFVIGPPLPSFDFEREKMKEYYEREYGSGTDYAYTYPAMAKAIQSAGRVIRTETDQGIIVLMDDRFLQSSFTQTFPQDWFVEHPRELVSTKILREVNEFWQGG